MREASDTYAFKKMLSPFTPSISGNLFLVQLFVDAYFRIDLLFICCLSKFSIYYYKS